MYTMYTMYTHTLPWPFGSRLALISNPKRDHRICSCLLFYRGNYFGATQSLAFAPLGASSMQS